MPARYAQHFLKDLEASHRIVEALKISPSDSVLEIGPGKGALTSILIDKADHVVAVEVDQGLVKELEERFASNPKVQVVRGDILKFDFQGLQGRFKVVGNLPYNLTSPILRRLSDWENWSEAVVMVQKEVGERLCAKVGTKAYGALTVGISLVAEAEPVLVLSESAFRPIPKVKSMVVRLLRRPAPLTKDINGTQKVIQAAFQQRRKTILNSLSHGLGLPKEKVGLLLKKAAIDQGIRPERIGVEKFIRFSQFLTSG